MSLIGKVTIKIVFSHTFPLGSKKNTVLPEYTSSFTLASTINMFFKDKINTIKMEFPLLEACIPVYLFVDIDIIMPACTAVFDTFHPLSCDVLSSLIRKLNKTTCVLDPFPTKLLMSRLSSILNISICIVNLCFSSGDFQHRVSPPSFFL